MDQPSGSPPGLPEDGPGRMGFACATLAQKDDVALLAEIFSGGRLMEQASVEARGGMIVKHPQRLQ